MSGPPAVLRGRELRPGPGHVGRARSLRRSQRRQFAGGAGQERTARDTGRTHAHDASAPGAPPRTHAHRLAGSRGLGGNWTRPCRDLSELAERACIQGALTHLARWHAERHGTARGAKGAAQSLVVLGLGKLGARELNFSSDIDLIFAYPEAGASDGERPLDNEEYFLRLGQETGARAGRSHTAPEGFVFRVDLRLRPFGEAGPLAMSFDAMEAYYQNHGREWERYALIKARPVAGDLKAGERLLQTSRPFVYRRYLRLRCFFESTARHERPCWCRKWSAGASPTTSSWAWAVSARSSSSARCSRSSSAADREPPLRERGIVAVLGYLGEKKRYLVAEEAPGPCSRHLRFPAPHREPPAGIRR